MITCISASGDDMIPFVVSSQVRDAVVWKLKIEGFRIGAEIHSRNGRNLT
jgi:mRNA-degrading endonuclease RelE of RelBE toxin-antitoxin system